jgi:hypothetical protein
MDIIEETPTFRVAEAAPMDTPKYDLAARLLEQKRVLELIPPPDACIQAGLSQEIIDILHPPGLEPVKKHSE